MKGFPNQIADLQKLSQGLQCMVTLVAAGEDPKNDGVFGPALVYAGVAGTGHIPMPVNEYIQEQLTRPASNQSFRTTARGLRELYRLLHLIDDTGAVVVVTDLGRKAAAFSGLPLDSEQIRFWRRAISNMTHAGDGDLSHPYQVLLRLVGRKPGITRAKTALALEARNDSAEELDRILELATLPEYEIRARIGVTQPNWDNAKKVLPRFAEQLGDVVREGQTYRLAGAPGEAESRSDVGQPVPAKAEGEKVERAGARIPRTSRQVTPQSIGRAGTSETFGEPDLVEVDPQALADAIGKRQDRLRRHNVLVKEVAAKIAGSDVRLFEDPFDILAVSGDWAVLLEVKTLEGDAPDERERVREALSQLLYYEAFVAVPLAGGSSVRKIAVFEKPISEEHARWLNSLSIATVWKEDRSSKLDALARDYLGLRWKD